MSDNKFDNDVVPRFHYSNVKLNGNIIENRNGDRNEKLKSNEKLTRHLLRSLVEQFDNAFIEILNNSSDNNFNVGSANVPSF